MKVNVAMLQGGGSLKLFTTPTGAQIYIDGKKYGTSPVKIDDLTAGEHLIRVVKKDYFSKEDRVNITAGKTQDFSMQLGEAAYLTIKTEPRNAAITINGKNAGKGSVRSYEVQAGEVTVQIGAAGYDTFKSTMKLAVGEEKNIEKELTSIYPDSLAQ